MQQWVQTTMKLLLLYLTVTLALLYTPKDAGANATVAEDVNALWEQLIEQTETVTSNASWEITKNEVFSGYAYAVIETSHDHSAKKHDHVHTDFLTLLGKQSVDGSWYGFVSHHELVWANDFNSLLSEMPPKLLDENDKAFMWLSSKPERAVAFSGHKLPWQGGTSSRLTAKGGSGHENQIDFGVQGPSIDGNIIASKPGTVVFVKESSNSGGCGFAYWQQTNMVVIQHSGSEYSWYVHLQHNSVPINVGQSVSYGDKIGVEGGTGFSCGNHLHYMASSGHTSWTDPNNAYAAPWATGINTVDFDEASWHDLTVNAWYLSQNYFGGSGCPAPNLVSPQTGATLSSRTVAFDWESVSGCQSNGYTLRVCTSAAMDNNPGCFYDQGHGGTSATVSISSSYDNQTLYWGVRAANATNGAAWAVRTFTIDPGSPPPSGQAKLYSVANYGGSVVWSGNTGFSNGPNADSYSLSLPSGWSAVTYSGDNKGGSDRCWDESENNFQSHGWHLRIQSIEVFSSNVCSSGGGDKVTLCTSGDANSGCWLFSVGVYLSLRDYDLNDEIKSVREVPDGMSVRLWKDSKLRSASECYNGRRAPLPDEKPWDLYEKVTSLIVYDDEDCPSEDTPTVMMFNHTNFNSYQWGMGVEFGRIKLKDISNGNSYYRNEAESLTVPPGYSVKLWDGGSFDPPISNCLTGEISSLGSLNDEVSALQFYNNPNCIGVQPPSSVDASNGLTSDGVAVTWSPVAEAAEYKLYRNTSSSSSGRTHIATTTSPSYVDTSAAHGTHYFYWVRAVAEYDEESSYSSAENGYRGLATPAGLDASDGTHSDRIALSYQVVTGATAYELYRSTSANSASSALIGSSATTTFDDYSAETATTYYYWVRAVNDVSSSSFSAMEQGERAETAPTAARLVDQAVFTAHTQQMFIFTLIVMVAMLTWRLAKRRITE